MSKRIKTIVKTCAKCHKPFSTADDNITLCREVHEQRLEGRSGCRTGTSEYCG